jgi:hypothetical protein
MIQTGTWYRPHNKDWVKIQTTSDDKNWQTIQTPQQQQQKSGQDTDHFT